MADQGAGELEKAEVDVGAAFVSSPQSFEHVQPGEPALDHPANFPEPGAVCDAAAGDQRPDAAFTQAASVWVGVVAAVTVDLTWAPARPATSSPDRRDCIQQREQLSDVVAVGAGQCDRQR